MLDYLLIPIFAVHLLTVNVALAGPLWCVYLSWREQRTGNILAAIVGRRLALVCLVLLPLGVGLGLGTLLLVSWMGGQQRYLDTLAQVPGSRWWGVVSELVFYALAISAYVAWWDRYRRRWWHRGLAILASTAIASHLPPLFAIISAISTRADLVGQPLDRHVYYSLMFDGEIVARTVHHWLAAVTAGGVMLMLLAGRAKQRLVASGRAEKGTVPFFSEDSLPGVMTPGAKSGQSPARAALAADWLIVSGARGAFTATLCQIPVGVWVMLSLAPLVREQLMGADLLGTLWMITSLVMALGLLHHLAAIALGDTQWKGIVRVAVILVIVTVLMVGTLHRTRTRAYELLGPPDESAPAANQQ